MAGKTAFGTVRTLGPKRYQGRYTHEGKQYSAGVHATAREAWAALAAIQTDMSRGEHIDPEKARVTFAEHAATVLEQHRVNIQPSTEANWRQHLRAQLLPTFGSMAVADITVAHVDQWWAKWAHRPGARKNAYAIMSKIMRYAVRWQIIKSSPCMVESAGKNTSPPRPTFSVDDFKAVVSHAPLDLGPVLWTMFAAHLRVGEVAGLNRGDYDRATGVLTVARQYVSHGPRALRATKTGVTKKVTVLAPGRLALEAHLDATTGPDFAAMFHGPRGDRLNPRHIQDAWAKARKAAGRPGMRVHDIRHTSLTLVAQSGTASIRDLMHRGGHTTPAAALIYQHASSQQDARVAAATDALLN